MNITEVLIKYYKDRGVSLEKVIDDPVFKSLPVQQQIAALKQHAADMQEGVKPNGVVSNSKTIALNVAKGIGAGAIGVGLNLLRQDSSTWEDKIFHSLAALGVGGLAGAINGTLQAVKDNNRKETSNQYLKQIAQKSGVDEATIRLLSSRGGYKPITPLIPFKMMSDLTPIVAHRSQNAYNQEQAMNLAAQESANSNQQYY